MHKVTYVACCAFGLAASSHALAAGEKILYRFYGSFPPALSQAPLVSDAAGNFYGTSWGGGNDDYGAVFEISPPTPGTHHWTEQVLYSFTNKNGDGSRAQGAVTLDGKGDIFGTTSGGGIYSGGTAWELIPPTGNGTWTEVILHSFGNGTDGNSPHGRLLLTSDGTFYGTAFVGGPQFAGTIFKLSKNGGSWTEQPIYQFSGGADGEFPLSTLVMDGSGNLYGTTIGGGNVGHGVVFELTPASGNAMWTETILHSFDADGDGQQPQTGVVFDRRGNLIGTTAAGGSASYGTVFELAKPAHGSTVWKETVLHNFSFQVEGAPTTTLPVFDAKGDIFGISASGTNFLGDVWEMTRPPHGGAWNLTILHNFAGTPDGAVPSAGLTQLKHGFIGITQAGGNSIPINGGTGQGTIFKITP
jgi:uncharacterized repeat protein (TIGR03803 family)